MYFPYVRGKQFELLALKEYASDLGASGRVAPIIEPVKSPFSSGGLSRALRSLVDEGVRPSVVVHPMVGELKQIGPSEVCRFLELVDPAGQAVDAAILVTADTTPDTLAAQLELIRPGRDISVCHMAKHPDLPAIAGALQSRVRRHIIPADARLRAYRAAFPGVDLVALSDGFDAQERNVDYLPVGPAEFSDDVLYYAEDGYAGFGDFLTIGNRFAEGGFSPRAVAIHWTYQDRADGPIMIRHFVSTSNEDISNVGRKYLQAAQKLVSFLPSALFISKAAEVMRASYEQGSYPGLGIVKKLSMQNHLEVVMKAISEP